jgi:Ca2+-binding EF-hand superfamily protein
MTWAGRLAAMLCVIALPVSAQPYDAATQTILSQLQPGATLNDYVERLRQEFRQLDADMDGVLSAADADLHDGVAAAQLRSAAAMPILQADLNGDGVVTADELRRFLVYQRRTQTGPSVAQSIESDVRRLMAADKDGDGKITLAEAMNAVDLRPENRNMSMFGLSHRVRQLLTLAHGGDGKLTLAEFEAAGAEQFRTVDTDGNGTISQNELSQFRQRQTERLRDQARQNADSTRERTEAEARAQCAMPKASDAAKVVVLSAHKSEALARVGLGSQDILTGTGEIRIEPGREPLYIVIMTHEPTIWRLTGAVERVERLVGAGFGSAGTKMSMGVPAGDRSTILLDNKVDKPVALIGVSGLPADRVTLLPRVSCLNVFMESKSSDAARTVALVRRDAGKDPVLVAGRYNVGAFVVPSGDIRSAYDDVKQPRLTIVKEFGTLTLTGDTSGVVVQTGPVDLETDLEKSTPGGVVDLDEKAIVATTLVIRYEILPGLAGLLQLQNSGALSRNRQGEFLIHRQIRFPAGLSGHSVKFLLLRDVPLPQGDPDGATVISEETGNPLKFDRR